MDFGFIRPVFVIVKVSIARNAYPNCVQLVSILTFEREKKSLPIEKLLGRGVVSIGRTCPSNNF